MTKYTVRWFDVVVNENGSQDFPTWNDAVTFLDSILVYLRQYTETPEVYITITSK